MPRKPAAIPQVRNLNGYWTYRYRDANRIQHIMRFGNVTKVTKGRADAELARRLSNSESPRENSGLLGIGEVCEAFVRDAETVYVRRDGSPTGEAANLAHGLQPLVNQFGKLPCSHLRPRHLKLFCEAQAKAGASRQMINKRINHIQRMLKWAKNEELIPAAAAPGERVAANAFDACKDFELLRRGRPAIAGGTIPRETSPVRSVADETVNQTLPHLPATVGNMIRLQLLSSMRPAEVCWLKMAEVDTREDPWLYSPSRHKTQHHGKERRIYLGPKAREILRPYRLRPRNSFVFRPADVKANAGELDVRAGGDHFTTRAYRDAIWQACDRAFPAPDECRGMFLALRRIRAKVKRGRASWLPGGEKRLQKLAKRESDWLWEHRWSPNQLRHSGLSEIVNRELAKATERATAIAGHGNRQTTRGYLDTRDELAAKVMEEAG